MLSPIVLELLTALFALASSTALSDPVVITISEIAFFILAMDPESNPRSDVLNFPCSALSISSSSSSSAQVPALVCTNSAPRPFIEQLQSWAQLMLPLLARRYPQHRTALVHDCIPLLLQVSHV